MNKNSVIILNQLQLLHMKDFGEASLKSCEAVLLGKFLSGKKYLGLFSMFLIRVLQLFLQACYIAYSYAPIFPSFTSIFKVNSSSL